MVIEAFHGIGEHSLEAEQAHSRAQAQRSPMMAWHWALYLALAFGLSSSLHANDKLMHGAAGYICQDLGQRASRRILRLDRVDAMIFSAFTCVFIGAVKEATDRKPDGGDLIAQVLGQAIRVTFEFDW